MRLVSTGNMIIVPHVFRLQTQLLGIRLSQPVCPGWLVTSDIQLRQLRLSLLHLSLTIIILTPSLVSLLLHLIYDIQCHVRRLPVRFN
jgi:hypothetical protein